MDAILSILLKDHDVSPDDDSTEAQQRASCWILLSILPLLSIAIAICGKSRETAHPNRSQKSVKKAGQKTKDGKPAAKSARSKKSASKSSKSGKSSKSKKSSKSAKKSAKSASKSNKSATKKLVNGGSQKEKSAKSDKTQVDNSVKKQSQQEKPTKESQMSQPTTKPIEIRAEPQETMDNNNMIKEICSSKIKLKRLWLEMQIRTPFSKRADGEDLSGKKYTFANFKFTEGEEDAQIKQVLDQVYSVDHLVIFRNVFTMELFNYLMASTIRIKEFSLGVDGIDVCANDLVKFCRRFALVNIDNTCETYTDPAIWSDEILISILPSTICKAKGCNVIGGPDSPMPITDRTLEAVYKSMPVYFSLCRIHLCITIEGIVKEIQTFLDNKEANGFYDLGFLQRNQKVEAERYLQKEEGRGFYFTRFSGSARDGVEHQYNVVRSTNDMRFFGRFSIGL